MTKTTGLDKKKLRRELEVERRRKFRARMLELRALIKLAVLQRQKERAGIKAQCATARRKLSEQCALRAERARVDGAKRIEAAKRDAREEESLEKIIRAGDRRVRKLSVRSTASERRKESDDEVRANLPSELLLAWEKHKAKVRSTQRLSRTEAFLKWAEENPEEIWALQNDDADRYVAEMVREYNRGAKALGIAAMEVPF